MKEYYRVQANVNLDAVYHNIKDARSMIKADTKIMAIIKADGYGHGAVEIAKAVDDVADAYGIAIVEEGMELRRAGVDKMILILGYTPEQLFDEVIRHNISQAVFTYEMAEALSRQAVEMQQDAVVHIKVDTGMGRIGFFPNEESADLVQKIAALPRIRLEGCFTHFACADEADKTSARRQLAAFQAFREMLEKRGIAIPIYHASNSAAIIDMPEANLDMVRMGISLYGLYPSQEVDKTRADLQPAMELVSHVSFVKTVEKGTAVGYGSTFIAPKTMRIATIPIGYADGYSRALSNKGRVLIAGKSAKIVGRVCMDQFMVDVTDIPEVKVGDTVTLVGKNGGCFLSVEEVSETAGSFNYEMVCNVGKRVPRVYYWKGRKISTRDYY